VKGFRDIVGAVLEGVGLGLLGSAITLIVLLPVLLPIGRLLP